MEKYDNSVFYNSYKNWLENPKKLYWDQMFMEVLNCCTSQCKKKAKGIIMPDLEGKALDATCKAMQKIKENMDKQIEYCHEAPFYEGLATEVWDCSEWTTKY